MNDQTVYDASAPKALARNHAKKDCLIETVS